MSRKVKADYFFPMDAAGHILNPCSFDNIPDPMKNLLLDIVDCYKSNEGQKLHSIWLRGSLPRGLYDESLSDIDIFALVKTPNIRWQQATWSKKAEAILGEKYVYLPPIEWAISSYYPNFYQNNTRLSFFLKTQSLLLLGEDFRNEIPLFKVNSDLRMNLKWLKEDVASYLSLTEPNIYDSRAISKVVLRSAFEMVMLRENKYTPDLRLCAETFLKYYPTQKVEIDSLLTVYSDTNIDLKSFKENINKVIIFIKKVNNSSLPSSK